MVGSWANLGKEGIDMSSVPKVSLQHTRVSDVIARTLDDLVGKDIVLKEEAVEDLGAARDLEALGVVGLTRARPPYDQPYRCTWYQGRYYCRFYRRGAWYLIWDQSEATEEMRDRVAEEASITREQVKEYAREHGVHEKWGCWRRDIPITEEEKREAEASGFFKNK